MERYGKREVHINIDEFEHNGKMLVKEYDQIGSFGLSDFIKWNKRNGNIIIRREAYDSFGTFKRFELSIKMEELKNTNYFEAYTDEYHQNSLIDGEIGDKPQDHYHIIINRDNIKKLLSIIDNN